MTDSSKSNPEPIGQMDSIQRESLDRNSISRLIDANRNRASEATRVVEDHCRFQLNDPQLSRKLKDLRHAIHLVSQQLLSELHRRPDSRTATSVALRLRDTAHDVGTEIKAADEVGTASIEDLLAANFARLQQSLRVLEEYAKLSSISAAAEFESFRYRSYQIQKQLSHAASAKARLENCLLCVLTDAADSLDSFRKRIALLIEAHVDIIQLRDKVLESRQLLTRARTAVEICRDVDTLLIINDRPDICQVANADGVHLGQTDFSVRDARQIVGNRIIGVSTHSLAQAEQAAIDGADYIGVGPVFASTTKSFASTNLQGCDLVSQVTQQITLPAFAIGGIDTTNIHQVIQAGARHVAVAGAVSNAANPRSSVKKLREELLANRTASSQEVHLKLSDK